MMATKKIDQYMNPYSVFALLVSQLSRIDIDLFRWSEKRRAVDLSPATIEDIEKSVDTLFHELPTTSNPKHLIEKGMPVKEWEYIQQWNHYGDFFYLLRFLTEYDAKLRVKDILASARFWALTHDENGAMIEFESLNDNVKETGIVVLPRIMTINDPISPAEMDEEGEVLNDGSDESSVSKNTDTGRTKKGNPNKQDPNSDQKGKNWATGRLPGIHGRLTHLHYYFVEDLVCPNHNYRYVGKHSFVGHQNFLTDKRTVRIAICPIGYGQLINTTKYKEHGKKYFAVTSLTNPAFVYDLIKAAQGKADIALFPEALGDWRVVSDDFYRELRDALKAENLPMPTLILYPSWWNNKKNELYVKSGSGQLLCIQQKQFPYCSADGVIEDLHDVQRVVHVVHIPNLGSFAFPICRDYLEEEYVRMIVQQLRVTFLLCPSYSPHKTQFDNEAPSNNRYGCYTIWCNTCAAYYKDKEEKLPDHIGFVAGPQPISKTTLPLSFKCERECTQGGICVFFVDISMDHTAAIACEHDLL